MDKISRRIFLKLSGAAAAGTLLSTTGCTPKTTPAPKATDAPAATPATAVTAVPPATIPPALTPLPPATLPPASTATPVPLKAYRRPEIIKFFPALKSQVVRGRDAAVWDGETLNPEKVRQLVDRSITRLTGISDVKKSWQALFNPDERIAIKVNVFRNSKIWTHPELVKAVVDSLQEAGIPGEQITIFDFLTSELVEGGFTINKDGPGVRCYGTDDSYSTSWKIQDSSFRMSDILVNSDALINMPILKSHMIAGFTFALKNHYGSVSYPDGLHSYRKIPAGFERTGSDQRIHSPGDWGYLCCKYQMGEFLALLGC